jgi:hypothetical protein
MNHLGYYERALGMGDEPSYGSRLGATIATGVLGAVVAYKVTEGQTGDSKAPIIGGGLAAIAAGAIGQAILPLSGILYWARAIIVPSGAGALVGLYLKRQHKAMLEESWSRRRPSSARA